MKYWILRPGLEPPIWHPHPSGLRQLHWLSQAITCVVFTAPETQITSLASFAAVLSCSSSAALSMTSLEVPPNNAFKPKLHRYASHMAEDRKSTRLNSSH